MWPPQACQSILPNSWAKDEPQLPLHPQSPTPFSAWEAGLRGGPCTGLAQEGGLISVGWGMRGGVGDGVTQEVEFGAGT